MGCNPLTLQRVLLDCGHVHGQQLDTATTMLYITVVKDACLMMEISFTDLLMVQKLSLKMGTHLSMENLIAEYMASLSDEQKDKLFPHNFTDGVVLECYDYVDAIENNRPPELDAEVGTTCEIYL